MFFSNFKDPGFKAGFDDVNDTNHTGTNLEDFLLSLKDVVETWGGQESYEDKYLKDPNEFLLLPFFTYNLNNVRPNKLGVVKHILVLGIGGSSMGAKAVYDAFFGYYDKASPNRYPKVHFIENVDENYVLSLINNVLSSFKKDELAVFVVCKSGKTFETLKNISIIYQDQFKNLFDGSNTYVISVKDNDTWRWGQSINAKLFEMQPNISGRFSVFSYVSLLPLSLGGVPIAQFLEGAKDCAKNLDIVKNIVKTRFGLYKNSLDIDVYFAFDERLKSLGEWMCSITAESLGKNGQGITPIVSVGSRDLHSLGQLYLEGKKDKVAFFLSFKNSDTSNLLILKAVKQAYNDLNIPYCEFVLDDKSSEALSYDLGYFIQFWFVYTVGLGSLMGVNPYNQPGVELYKKYLSE